jgi:hypothetical protein
MNRPSIKSIDDLRALIGPSMRVPPHLVGTFDIDKIIERDRLEGLKKPLLKALTKLGNMPGVSNKNKPALVDWLVEHPEPVDQTVGSSKGAWDIRDGVLQPKRRPLRHRPSSMIWSAKRSTT